MDCLRLADQFKHESISLPAMGTGNLSYPAQRVAAMMVGAAIQYYNDCPNSTLKLIQFVLLPSDNSTISEFQKEMQHPSQPLTDPDVVLEMPEKWEPMGEEHLKLILLNETSQEYQDVKKNIMETLLNKTIISIKRIQNWRLYQCYMIMKKSMDQKNEGKQNERILFHGTCKTSLDNINNSGFNRNYCGKNGTVYGKGAYFAREAIYSDSYATPDAKTSHKHIYQGDPLGVDFVQGRVDSSRRLAGLRAPCSRIPIVRSDPFVPGAGISPSGRISSSGNLCHVLSDKLTYRQQEQQEPIPRR
ncbi:protein mono-ADP-ribosyltransferase PARP14-like [Lethenteron reissneri]|uniref:protein mono-ADP-ribosyltransferase PARP14-like n=1 Tax=Lethenteron reissneri TaxID=7753 RepID=UPI002AB78458|nr:protein mono-ADP-ribosyltransferase PARP14-like [Lethenteron reissneri]